jgi:hypothetical protein
MHVSLVRLLIKDTSKIQGKSPNQGLGESHEEVVVHCNGKRGAEQRINRHLDVKLDYCIDVRVCSLFNRLSLNIPDLLFLPWDLKTVQVELDKCLVYRNPSHRWL